MIVSAVVAGIHADTLDLVRCICYSFQRDAYVGAELCDACLLNSVNSVVYHVLACASVS